MVSLPALDQNLAQIRIGAVFGHAVHVVEEVLFRVGTEVGLADLLVGQIRHQFSQIVDAVVDAAKGAGGEAAVTAGFVFGRALQHQHRNAVLRGGDRRAKRRIAGADDDQIRRGG